MADWPKATFAFLLVMLAGCTQSSQPQSTQDVVAPTNVAGEESADGGNVIGVVFDEEDIPLEGARVGLLGQGVGLDYTATTDSAGSFQLLGVPPGAYALLVQKRGFDDLVDETVRVEAGQTVEKLVKLFPVPSDVAWVDIFEDSGMLASVTWSSSVIPVNGGRTSYPITFAGNDNYRDWKLKDRADALEGLVAEAKWTSQTALSGNLLLQLEPQQASEEESKYFLEVEGSPPSLRAEANKQRITEVLAQNDRNCPADADPVRDIPCKLEYYVYAGTGNTGANEIDASVLLQERYDMAVSHFYRMPIPEGYTYLVEQ